MMIAGVVVIALGIAGLIAAKVSSVESAPALQVTQSANPDMVRAVVLLRQGLEETKKKNDEQDKTLAAHDKKFGEVDRSVSDLNQRFGALSEAQRADPESAKALKAQVEALEKLIKSMQIKTDADAKVTKDKISALETDLQQAKQEAKTFSDKVIAMISIGTSAYGQTAPPASTVDYARYESVVRDCQGVRNFDPANKEVDANRINALPYNMYTDIGTQCIAKRKTRDLAAGTDQGKSKPPVTMSKPLVTAPPTVRIASNVCLPGYMVNPLNPEECIKC
jgi:myosin heavy subunit